MPRMDIWMKEGFEDPELPYAMDLDQKTVLMLVNTHESFYFPEPIPPNLIPVAGLHIKEVKPLPEVSD